MPLSGKVALRYLAIPARRYPTVTFVLDFSGKLALA
jgi:hypothetical protein